MLSLNVTVIPFLLETLISVENVTEWMFGPEYVFQLNNTIIVYTDRIEIQDITAIVNCRLKESAENNLCCHAHEIIISMMMRPVYENMSILKISRIRHIMSFSSHVITNKVPDQLFEIEFGRLGVRVFEMKTSSKSKHAHLGDSIIDAIEQFHIGIDLSVAAGESMKNYENVKNGSHVISSFPQNENTLRAYNCTTSCIITYTPSNEYNKDGEFEVRRNKTKFDFHLKLLPISYTNPNDRIF
nr:PREDICTED: uncharacterized protein LOC105674406 isoform X2 [Linepithema humile]